MWAAGIQVLLGGLFIVLAILTISKQSFVMKNYKNLQLPSWFIYVIGFFQLVVGVLSIISYRIPVAGSISSSIILGMMTVAFILHFKKKDQLVGVFPSLIVGILAVITFI